MGEAGMRSKTAAPTGAGRAGLPPKSPCSPLPSVFCERGGFLCKKASRKKEPLCEAAEPPRGAIRQGEERERLRKDK